MHVGAASGWRGLACLGLLTGAVAGCSEAGTQSPKPSASTRPTTEASGATETVTKSGGTLGAVGSACELPVTFDTAEDWKAEAVDGEVGQDTDTTGSDSSGDPDGGLSEEVADALLRQGPVTLACEVDAKPAGNIGYIRVWTGEPGQDDARTVLEAFVAAEDGASKATYRTFEAGGVSGVEVEYVYTSEFLEESKKECAFAVTTADGPVVVHLGGLDTEEHTAMLPAYELAKRTVRTT
ncbi:MULTISPECIES: lipoprotein [Streptomyces]|uniref:DUF3558 domain-containing protein n=1 Tax=Streptomyces dengpaensis TaxID=2049881 RepID=A0ABN5IBM4_9ACTN|nr:MULTISPECIES: lipoprotein [Streptomyces]AVH60582.1 hypothetical protein C4B68_37835 [Streptomyces dengpaensis]PIB04441.1 hypothetical protein B1C81_33110 [Streptomyces sp. HG99]